MNNKKLWSKIGISLVLLWWLSVSLTSAAKINVHLWANVLPDISRLSPIHFADNGNDFWGFIYFSNVWDDIFVATGEVEAWGMEYVCDKQLRWFYYDAQRWERLWPLDERTAEALEIEDSGFSWWLYTACLNEDSYQEALGHCDDDQSSGDADREACVEQARANNMDNNGFYGMVKHTYSGNNFTLIAWVEYQTGSNGEWIKIKSGSELAPTFQRYDNNHPVWFIYDYNGWVGFVWCEVGGNKQTTLNSIVNLTQNWTGIREYFTYSWSDIVWTWDGSVHINCTDIGSMNNSLIGLLVEWLVGMGKNTSVSSLQWNQSDKMQYFSSANVNSATLINYVRQKAELLCRGKWNAGSSAWITCISKQREEVVEVDATQYAGNTLIVKNGNVKIKPFTGSWNDGRQYDIFIDSGSLIIDESEADKYVIKYNWFVNSGAKADNFNSTVSGSIAAHIDTGTNYEYTWENVAVAAVLKWNFIVNGHVRGTGDNNLNNKYFMYGKFTSLDTYDEIADKFGRRCGLNGKWSDGNYCPASPSSWNTQHPYQTASLVVIDQNYDSPLFW